jgi:hypothetical protein
MTRRTRLIILLVCVVCFLVIAPILVLYSEGYRFDFENMKITETGGIYVRTFPTAEQIIIDSSAPQKPGFLNNYVFVQSLLPKNHSVLVKKEGCYDYTKTLAVKEREVTKLENVFLFKKDLAFDILEDATKSPFLTQNKIEKFIIKNNNLYYSDIESNAGLTATQKTTPIIKNIIAFKVVNGNIIWLGLDGFLYKSNSSGQNSEKLSLTAIKITKGNSYKITADNGNIFLNNGSEFLILDNKTNEFNKFASSTKNEKFSPDGKNLAYSINNKVYIYNILDDPSRTFLKKGEGFNLITLNATPSDILWLNNDYLIFIAGDKIIISEIDYRGNVNSITMPETTKIADKIYTIKSPQIYLDQSSKLYILTQKNILISEKLSP